MERATQRLLTLVECEARTGRKVSTWRKAIAQRRIPFVRSGRSVRIPEEVVDELIQQGWQDPVESTAE